MSYREDAPEPFLHSDRRLPVENPPHVADVGITRVHADRLILERFDFRLVALKLDEQAGDLAEVDQRPGANVDRAAVINARKNPQHGLDAVLNVHEVPALKAAAQTVMGDSRLAARSAMLGTG